MVEGKREPGVEEVLLNPPGAGLAVGPLGWNNPELPPPAGGLKMFVVDTLEFAAGKKDFVEVVD